MHVELLFLLIGGTILVGFAGRLLFKATRIPDVLVLMGLGLILGQYLSPEARRMVHYFAPYVGTLALIMILFEGGLHINPIQAIGQARSSLALSALSFFVTALLLTSAVHFILGWELIPSVLFGIVLGCTSSAIVIPVAKQAKLPEDTRTLIDLEAAFSDTFAIVALLSVISLAEVPGNIFSQGLIHLVRSFGIATVSALALSICWLLVLEYTKDKPLSYLLTFAGIILLYALVEMCKGSGAIAVFLFGILITESKRLPRWIFVFGKPAQSSVTQEAHETLQWFHQEMTFLVRTFFFVYLGFLFEASRLSAGIAWAALLFAGLIVLGRGSSVYLLRRMLSGHSIGMLGVFLPRGLISAVLASLPLAHGFEGTERFLDYVVPVIILTNILMAIGLFACSAGVLGQRFAAESSAHRG